MASVEADSTVCTDLYLGMSFLELLGGGDIKTEIVLRSTGPKPWISIGLAPYLPIGYLVIVSVCPALRIVSYDVLAD